MLRTWVSRSPIDGRHRLLPSAPGRGRKAGVKGSSTIPPVSFPHIPPLAGLMEAIMSSIPLRSAP